MCRPAAQCLTLAYCCSCLSPLATPQAWAHCSMPRTGLTVAPVCPYRLPHRPGRTAQCLALASLSPLSVPSGYPTGLGALLVRTEVVPLLHKVFWG